MDWAMDDEAGFFSGPNDNWNPADDYEENDENDGDNMTDAEADAATFASAGWGTNEDYGYYGGGDDW